MEESLLLVPTEAHNPGSLSFMIVLLWLAYLESGKSVESTLHTTHSRAIYGMKQAMASFQETFY